MLTNDAPVTYGAPGYILYLRNSVLMARRLDLKTGDLRGDPMPVVDGVASSTNPAAGFGRGEYSVSDNGILVYRPDTNAQDQLVWFDRAGNQLSIFGGSYNYSNPALSPDGSRLAVCIRDPASLTRDIWVFDLARGSSTKLTFDPKDDTNPVWSPDGKRIVFSSDRRGQRDLYVKNSNGTGEEELLLESANGKSAEDWSRDGRSIIYDEAVPGRGNDLCIFSLDTRKAFPFLQTQFIEDEAQFSPDGKWVAYRSNDSGRDQVHVQSSGNPGSAKPQEKWVVSSSGGVEPQWRGDGKELFYTSASPQGLQTIMAMDMAEHNGALVAGIPHPLFEVRLKQGGRNRWVVTADGKKFLAILPVQKKPATSLNVILNWPSLLKN